jgi:hypothetical protein
VFLDKPTGIFTTKDVMTIINKEHNLNIKKEVITAILTRLYRRGKVLRTPTQLTQGYHYSLENKDGLVEQYKKYILPFDFKNREELIDQLVAIPLQVLYSDRSFGVDQIEHLDFVKKYGAPLFSDSKTQQFLSLLVGYSIGDGNINPELTKSRFFFRKEEDAHRFAKDFEKLFYLEKLRVKPSKYGQSYIVDVCKASQFTKLLHFLGAPKGNKVLQPFSIPDWIYRGPDHIKAAFVSAMIGCEGSAPSGNRWRIQFVLSKSKEHVPNLISFVNQLRTMLYHIGIETSHIQLRKQKERHFNARFYIKGRENINKFYKQLEFSYASEKQEVLKELINRTAAEVECAMIL